MFSPPLDQAYSGRLINVLTPAASCGAKALPEGGCDPWWWLWCWRCYCTLLHVPLRAAYLAKSEILRVGLVL
jgi:hypothetical protein